MVVGVVSAHRLDTPDPAGSQLPAVTACLQRGIRPSNHYPLFKDVRVKLIQH